MTQKLSANPQFQYPYDQQLCETHRLATRIWRGISDQNEKHEVCSCCHRKVGSIEVQTQCKPNSSEFSFLGVGIPLFFKFIKYSIAILITLTLVFSIYALSTNVSSNNCTFSEDCVPTLFNSMSIVNKKQEYYFLRIQNYILLAFVLCCFILLHVFRCMFRKTQENIDKSNVSASDYSIILKRLPYDCSKSQIKEMINKEIEARNFKAQHKFGNTQKPISCCIESIVMSYNITNFLAEKENQVNEFKQTITKDFRKKTAKQFIPKQIAQPDEPGEIAIVVFSDPNTKECFIQEPSFLQKLINYFFPAFPPLSDLKIGGKYIAVERAPQPEDIFWENAHITPWDRTRRKMLLNFLSFILLFGGGACQYGLAVWQTDIEDPTDKFLIGTIASICVFISNTILTTFLDYTTKWQRMGTQSQYLQVLTFKLIIQQFLNTGVFVVIANVLADFSESMLQNSLADTITQIMILNAIMPNLTVFSMNYFEVKGRIMRFIFIWTGYFKTTQLEANHLFELPKPDFTEKYSYVVKTLWLTAFYAPFVPIVVPISAIGLAIKYFLQKFLFSRSYSVSSKISASLNRSCMQGLEYIPLIFSIGQFCIYIYLEVFIQETPDDWLIPIYVCLGFSFLNLALPMDALNLKMVECVSTRNLLLRTSKQQEQIITFKQAVEQFQVTYEISYPANKARKGKKKDTLFNSKRPAEIFAARPSLFGLKQDIPLIDNSSLQKSDKKLNQEEEESSHTIYPAGTSSILKEKSGPELQQTEHLIIKHKNSQKQQNVKFSTIAQTRPNESQLGSVYEFSIQPLELEPEPGKMMKNKQKLQEASQNQQNAKRLFQHFQKKKISNQLIEIKQQNDQDTQIQ